MLATIRGWSGHEGNKAAEAVFLVTPKLAHLFEPDSVFLKKAITRIYGKDSMLEVFSLVAVVDKIPGKWNVEERKINDCEGFSLMIKPPTPSPFKKHEYPPSEAVPGASSKPSQGVLEFSSAFGLMEGDSRTARIFNKLTLANTLFVNGRNATMFYTMWQRSSDDLEPAQSRYLSSFRFMLPFWPMDMEVSSIPLVPLTEFRTVTTAMGNIIREIQVGDKLVPASTELEAAVMKSVNSMAKEKALETQTRVYAFVSDAGAHEYPESQSSTDHPFTRFVRGLKLGGGLYQVIGGGGGWGNKRGLLALDPANPSVDAAHPDSAIDVDGNFSIGRPNAETNLAKRGQSIRFYQLQHNLIKARNSPSHDHDPSPRSTDNLSLHLLTERTEWGLASPAPDDLKCQHIMVGTIPTQDVETVLPATGQEKAEVPRIVELQGVFGALSETSIHMEIQKYPNGTIHESPLLEHQSELTPSLETVSVETTRRTISVPYSYLAFRNIGEPWLDKAGGLKRSSDSDFGNPSEA